MVKRIIPERPDQLVRLHVAEPSPLGLFGLALGCMLLFCVDFDATEGDVLQIPWIFYLPGLCQFVAGMADFARHNVFGATAFTGYAVFWFGLGTSIILEEYIGEHNKDRLPNPTRQHTAVMCIGYLIFTCVLCIVSMGINKMLFIDLLWIAGAYLFLMLHIFEDVSSKVLGVFLVGICVTSLYGFAGVLLLKMAGGEVLPLGKPLINWQDYILDDKYQSHSHINNPKTNKKFDNLAASDDVDHVVDGTHTDGTDSGENMKKIKNNATTSQAGSKGSKLSASQQYLKMRTTNEHNDKDTEKLELVTH